MIDMQYENKHVLVTGGLGFIGSNLVRRLVKLRAWVTILDDMFTGSLDNLESIYKIDYNYYHDSVTDYIAVRELIDKSDIIFHLAARNIVASTNSPVEDYSTNIGGTLNILMAMKENGNHTKRMVYTSSCSVYGNPRYLPINEDDNINLLTPYAVSKYAGEGYCMAFHESYDVPVTVLRLSNVYGPWQSPNNPYCGVVAKSMNKAVKGEYIEIHGDGLSTRDFTYVDDVVEAILLAGISPRADGEVFNVATGIETSIIQLAELISHMCPVKSKYDDGHIYLNPIYIDRRDIDNIRRRVINIEKIRMKLGWMPKMMLREGLYITKAWLEEHNG